MPDGLDFDPFGNTSALSAVVEGNNNATSSNNATRSNNATSTNNATSSKSPTTATSISIGDEKIELSDISAVFDFDPFSDSNFINNSTNNNSTDNNSSRNS